MAQNNSELNMNKISRHKKAPPLKGTAHNEESICERKITRYVIVSA